MTDVAQLERGRHLARSARVIKANLSLPFRRGAKRVRSAGVKTGSRIAFAATTIAVAAALIVLSALLLDEAAIKTRPHWPDILPDLSRIATRLGKSDWILIPTAVLATVLTFVRLSELSARARFQLYRANVWLSYVFVGVGLPSLIATLLKRMIGRPRPRYFEEHGLYGFHTLSADSGFASFPSGHSTTIGALAMVLALLSPRLWPYALLLALVVGFSRVGVGAHHPSDVVAGLVFGALTAWFVAHWFAGRGLLFHESTGIAPLVRPAMRFSRLRRSADLRAELSRQLRNLLAGRAKTV
jgi:membrane-associated phospholipid phosphatase